MHETRQTLGDLLVSETGLQAMLGQHRIVQIGECSDRLCLHARHPIELREVGQFVAGLRTENVGENPHGVQRSPFVAHTLSQRLHHSRRIVTSLPFDLQLSFEPFVVALRIQLLDPTRKIVGSLLQEMSSCRFEFLGERRLVVGGESPPDILDSIHPPASPFRTLPVGPIGDQQRAVAIDDEIRRLEAVGIVFGTGDKLNFVDRLQTVAAGCRRVPHHRSTPFAEIEAAILGRELRLAVVNAAGR